MTRIQKAKKAKAVSEKLASKPIRFQPVTIIKLQKVLTQVNKKELGKRVRPDAVIDLALELIGVTEIERLRHASMSNSDRFEMAFRNYAAKDKSITKDAFMGMLLGGAAMLVAERSDAEVTAVGPGASCRQGI